MKTMKKILAAVLALAMILAMSACGGSTAQAPAPAQSAPAAAPAASTSAAPASSDPLEGLDPINLVLADAVAETESGTQAGMAFAEAIKEKSNGKITIDYKAGGQLGSHEEMIEAMSLGQLDIARLDFSYVGEYCPGSQLLFLPFLIADYDHFDKILQSQYIGTMTEELDAYNIHLIDFVSAGFRLLLTKTPITKPEDCKNILFRSPGSQIYLDTFSRLGFSPEVISFNEVYTALQSGIVDGTDNSVPVAADGEYYKLCPYVCRSNHMFSFTEFCVGTEFWNSLPEAYQTIIEDCIHEECAKQRVACQGIENDYYDKMAADGATITTWDNWDELVNLFTPYWSETTDKIGGWAPDFVEEVKAML